MIPPVVVIVDVEHYRELHVYIYIYIYILCGDYGAFVTPRDTWADAYMPDAYYHCLPPLLSSGTRSNKTINLMERDAIMLLLDYLRWQTPDLELL